MRMRDAAARITGGEECDFNDRASDSWSGEAGHPVPPYPMTFGSRQAQLEMYSVNASPRPIDWDIFTETLLHPQKSSPRSIQP
jgi:hypothetical protein